MPLRSDVNLQPHQAEIQQRSSLAPQRLLLAHALGSGKSLSGLAAAEAVGEPYTAFAPASLRTNYKKEIAKFTDQTVPSAVQSYSELAQGKPVPHLGTVIFDEAHSLRNPNAQRTQRAIDVADRAKQVLLLSGSPLVNGPGDLAPLVRMLTGRQMTPDEFEKRYVGSEDVYASRLHRMFGVSSGREPGVQNKEELKNLLAGHVHYYDPGKPTVPTTYEDVHVTMGPEQHRLYRAILGQVPPWVQWRLKHDIELSGPELRRTVAFLTGLRSVGLSDYPYVRDKDPLKAFERSPKLVEAHRRLTDFLGKDPRTKALVFSNFKAGLIPFSAALRKSGVPHAVFTGDLTDADRQRVVDDYNNDRIRAVLLGPSGTEGLSFRGTNRVMLLDPHFGPVRPRQAVGRALRYDSHTGLPADLQNVHVERYFSRLPLSSFGKLLGGVGIPTEERQKGTDDLLHNIATRKERLNAKFNDLLREIGTPHKFASSDVATLHKLAALVPSVSTEVSSVCAPTIVAVLREVAQENARKAPGEKRASFADRWRLVKLAALVPQIRPADVYVIRGNPEVDRENAAKYDAFYNAIKEHAESLGHTVALDAGLPHTTPPGGKFWIGHSRGADRLRFAQEHGATPLRLDDYEPAEARQQQEKAFQDTFKRLGVSRVADVPVDQRPQPGAEHYTYNDDMRAAVASLLTKPSAAQPPSVLDKLKAAKRFSDAGDYASKTALLRELMQQAPQDWVVDSVLHGRYAGVTHIGSGFRLHVPVEAIADLAPKFSPSAANPFAPQPPAALAG